MIKALHNSRIYRAACSYEHEGKEYIAVNGGSIKATLYTIYICIYYTDLIFIALHGLRY